MCPTMGPGTQSCRSTRSTRSPRWPTLGLQLARGRAGHGIVGGRLHSSVSDAGETARIALRVLRGEKPESIPVAAIDSYTYQYDWRQLQRWSIDEPSCRRAARFDIASHRCSINTDRMYGAAP